MPYLSMQSGLKLAEPHQLWTHSAMESGVLVRSEMARLGTVPRGVSFYHTSISAKRASLASQLSKYARVGAVGFHIQTKTNKTPFTISYLPFHHSCSPEFDRTHYPLAMKGHSLFRYGAHVYGKQATPDSTTKCYTVSGRRATLSSQINF